MVWYHTGYMLLRLIEGYHNVSKANFLEIHHLNTSII